MKIRKGFVSNSSSTSFVLSKKKSNDEDISVTIKISMKDLVRKVITTKEELKAHFLEYYHYDSWEYLIDSDEFEDSEERDYITMLSAIERGDTVYICEASSDDSDNPISQFFYNDGVRQEYFDDDITIISGAD